MPISAIAYVGLQPSENNQASALMNVARNFGGTLGISSVQTMLARRSQWHQARLVETLNPLNPDYIQGVGQFSRALGQSASNAGDASTQAIAGTLSHPPAAGPDAVLYRRLPRPDDRRVRARSRLLFLMRGNKGGAPAGGGA